MQERTTKGIYHVWSHFYDVIWTAIVHRRTRKAIGQMGIQPGERVCDIGVGTGLALQNYPRHAQVLGVDLSEAMLRHAKRRARQGRMDHIALTVANALELPFPDNSFDHVMLSHVITVVSDPVRLVAETRRVTRPGGQIVIINHFQSTNRLIALIEKWLCPLCQQLGWRSDLPLAELLRNTGLQADFRYKLDSVDLFETVFLTNEAPITRRKAVAAA
jgi:phosphatidylethanolamine/phosphatidyl-N-methylethanolamine N-methyltransferase